MLQGKKILLGVTGSIAAYKTPELVRQLVQQGATVKVIVTAAAKDFVSPLVLSTVSKNETLQTFTSEDNSTWNNHVELGLWCDIFLVAPLSANTLAKFANGICDNLLTAVFLSCRNTVMVAPAMDVDMFKHPSTQKNLEIIAKNNIKIIGPESGELASGLTGKGRMTEPEDIVQEVINYFNPSLPLRNKIAVVTTGPTQEALDPVRFIGNHSSGKMGVAIANCLAAKGASVILISGPSVSLGNLNKSI
ncbi:MAG TPA: bifunctional phosphopantothenoylcysteine decarboxylase/phosphopantothenate--cysteine ligase CoaBC, partial [Bacteroidia bacterium]|nr:bifunctional phosphopantothenoylcysteine decarboxylase/phosphopantothenate--cysteine ligase CoaBC [Bacteroidia bacterium]